MHPKFQRSMFPRILYCAGATLTPYVRSWVYFFYRYSADGGWALSKGTKKIIVRQKYQSDRFSAFFTTISLVISVWVKIEWINNFKVRCLKRLLALAVMQCKQIVKFA